MRMIEINCGTPFADDAFAMSLMVAVALALAIAPQTAAAQSGARSGKEVVDAVCIACHGSGANGAPKIGDKKAWSKRAAQGLTSLSQNAIKGIRQMPPHGGNPGLTDIEIERAITYMVNQSGGHWTEPISRTRAAAARTGEQVVSLQCAKCHETGAGGAPKIGDQRSLDTAAEAGPRSAGSLRDQRPRRHAPPRRHGQSHRCRIARRDRLHAEWRHGAGKGGTRRERARAAPTSRSSRA